jgi:4-amino-4-deoxy-L-arabinose transferase-like glycosyltransferase
MLAVLAAGLLARRHFSRKSGAPAMLVLASTPVVGWLCTVSYVDLGPLFYTTLGLSFFLDWLRQRERGRTYAVWAGVCLGLAMAMKMQSLLFWAVLVAVALWSWWRGRACRRLPFGQVVAFAAVAALVAAPWYVKSWVWTGNPVYPFAYSVFGGKEWSTWQAQQYTYAQQSWGPGELPPVEEYWKLPPLQRAFLGPHRPDHLLLAPFYLTFYPWYDIDKGAGQLNTILYGCAGPLYLALLPLLFLIRRRRRAWAVIGWALIPVVLWWLWSAQYTRYFLSGLGWLAAPAAWAALRLARRGVVQRWVVGLALAAVLALAIGVSLAREVALLPLFTGQATREEYLSASLPPYRPSLWLNQAMQPGDQVIVYGEPRLFYLDRPYLWGDPGYHHLLVYDKMNTAADLIAGYRSLGVNWVMLNLAFLHASTVTQAHLNGLLQAAATEGRLQRVPIMWPGRGYVVFRVAAPGTAGGG